jgi:hypothetical protein
LPLLEVSDYGWQVKEINIATGNGVSVSKRELAKEIFHKLNPTLITSDEKKG